MRELVEKAMNGDKNSFSELINYLKMDLYKIAKVRLKNEDDILDAIQETIISSYKTINKLNTPDNFKKWIIKILINKCNNIYLEKNNKNISLEECTNIYEYIEEKDFSNLEIEDILKYLNDEEKMIITLYYLEDYKSKEIAWLLDMNENTVKTKISRAKSKLKTKLRGGNN